jgi:hypothetical protein
VVNALHEWVGGGGEEHEGERGCRSRVDTRIYPGCRCCSLHLILVGEIDDIILHNSGLPRRPESVQPRAETAGEKERDSRHPRAIVQPASKRGGRGGAGEAADGRKN